MKQYLIVLGSRPPRRLYFWLLPTALLVALILFLAKMTNPIGEILWFAPVVISRGLQTFPIGLFSLLIADGDLLREGLYIFSIAGYLFYVVLVSVGAWLHSRPLFWIAVALLALNVVGCQLRSSIEIVS